TRHSQHAPGLLFWGEFGGGEGPSQTSPMVGVWGRAKPAPRPPPTLARVVEHEVGKKNEDADDQDQANHAFDQPEDKTDHQQADDDCDDRIDTGDIHNNTPFSFASDPSKRAPTPISQLQRVVLYSYLSASIGRDSAARRAG